MKPVITSELYGVLKISVLVDHARTKAEVADFAGPVRPVRIATRSCSREEANQVFAIFKERNQHIDGSMLRATWTYEETLR